MLYVDTYMFDVEAVLEESLSALFAWLYPILKVDGGRLFHVAKCVCQFAQ